MPPELAIIILNYGTPALTEACLASLEPESRRLPGLRAIVVDNASPDDSAQQLAAIIDERGWSRWARLVRAEANRGFAAGNNIGITAIDAPAYVLLNSDTIVRPGAMSALLDAARAHPSAGILGPRLEDPDGTPQPSAFRLRTPLTEFLAAAATGPLTRALGGRHVALPPADHPHHADWLSFACVLIRREVIARVGLLDEGYFMYFEDIDYCRRARRAGFHILYWPAARVVHLRGRTSPVKADTLARRRRPRYYYASRARYFAKFYGRGGLWATNLLWSLGRTLSAVRQLAGRPRPTCRREGLDNWTNCWRPLPGSSGRTP